MKELTLEESILVNLALDAQDEEREADATPSCGTERELEDLTELFFSLKERTVF